MSYAASFAKSLTGQEIDDFWIDGRHVPKTRVVSFRRIFGDGSEATVHLDGGEAKSVEWSDGAGDIYIETPLTSYLIHSKEFLSVWYYDRYGNIKEASSGTSRFDFGEVTINPHL